MNELTTSTASIVPTTGDNFELSASNPAEMVQCHSAAIQWCNRKLELVRNECKELLDAFNEAKARKWKSSVLERHWKLSEKRLEFYKKILAAFEAGYYIVPNFPVTLFAIRTDKEKPQRMWARLRSSRHQNFEQAAQQLPVGEGEYKNPQPLVSQHDYHKDEKGNETWACEATDWNEMEFPANMARLHVMEAATQAMDRKIFDEVGFLPQDYKRNPDPLLIGRIYDPKPVIYGSKKCVSFIIAWHIDTKNL